MSVMGEAVASIILGGVLDRLGSVFTDELRSLKDVGEDLEKLQSTLCTIRSVLADAEGRQVKGEALVAWLRKIKDVAYEIDDIWDEAAVKALRDKLNPLKRTYSEMMSNCLSFPESLQFRREMAKKIQKIQKRLDMISQEKSKFHLREGAATEHSEAIMTRETGSYVNKSQVVGREEEEKKIIDFLLHKCNEQNLGVISIVGLGGLGKTTLARLAYNDDVQVSEHFETKMWVYVSEKFDVRNVITSIIESIEGKKLEPLSMDLIEQKLLKQIEGKKFLLVLDDVWNEEYEQWDMLESLLKNGAKGSKVIMTTRNARVADVMKSDESVLLGMLPDDECWKLFQKHAFKSADDAKKRNLEVIGKEIMKKCGGLPLAAKALGGTLYNKNYETWTQFRDEKGIILPALMLSYNHLSPRLKQYFAYCSIFPKGTYIYVPMLVQLWIAEGFVVDSSEGSWYVDQLISRSLLEKDVTKDRFHCKNDVVKMHDMVHNLAQFIAGDECSIVDSSDKNANFPLGSRYASLVLHKVTSSTTQILSSGQKLRTFHLTTIIRGDNDTSHQVLETIVSKMQLLRALHLPYLLLEELPVTITKLVHLRYLDLSYTSGLKSLPETIRLLHNLQTLKLNHTELVTLPKSIGDLVMLLTLEISACWSFHSLNNTIGNLQQLQYLDLSYANNLQALPESLCSLCKLQRLDFDGCYSLTSMPVGIGRLSQLRKLPTYVLGDGKKCASLAELGTLMNLEGHLCIKNLQNVKDVAEASAANLRKKQRINSLGLEWDFDADWSQERYEKFDDFENKRKESIERVADMDGKHVRLMEDVLSDLQPHQKLKDLRIKDYVGKTLPGWMMDLSDLVELKLESFGRCDNLQALEKLSCLEVLELKRFFMECLPQLGQLPRLRVLRLYMLPRVKCLDLQLYGGVGAFPALEELKLEMMLGLEEWSGNSISEEGDDFLSRLSTLVIRDCPKLRGLPRTVFPSVKKLGMNADDELLLGCLERGAFPNLYELSVYNCIDTEDESSMPEALVQRLHSVPDNYKFPKEIRWDHSELEIEKMRVETLERIAKEIEKKLVIQPSSEIRWDHSDMEVLRAATATIARTDRWRSKHFGKSDEETPSHRSEL